MDAAKSYINSLVTENTFTGNLILLFLIFCAIVIIYKIVKKIFFMVKEKQFTNPMIIRGINSGSCGTFNGSIFPRSVNKDGIEFTYQWWMIVHNFDGTGGKDLVFAKTGPNEPSADRDHLLLACPAVMIDRSQNVMTIQMNSFTRSANVVEIPNIPRKKWMHCAICVRNRNVDVMINGNIVKRMEMTDLPMQNYGPLQVYNGNGMFSLSNVQYHNRYLTYDDIYHIVEAGPDMQTYNVAVPDEVNTNYLSQGWYTS